MDPRIAQAGLEYLMTYGWALVLIVTVAGVLFFVFAPPAQEVQIVSESTKFLVKSGNVTLDTGAFEIQAQNGTGLPITISSVIGENIAISSAPSGAMPAGSPFVISGFIGGGYIDSGSITITYTAQGYEKNAVISFKGSIAGFGGGAELTACGDITEPGNYYLSGPLSGANCLNITAEGPVSINCQGNTVSGSYPIQMPAATSLGLTNCTIDGGVNLSNNGAAALSCSSTTIQQSAGYAIENSGSNKAISNCTINSSGGGIRLQNFGNTVTNCNITAEDTGVVFSGTLSGTLTNSNIISNSGIAVFFWSSEGGDVVSNPVISGGTRGVYSNYSNNVTLQNNPSISGVERGLRYLNTTNATISNNNFSSSGVGIEVVSASLNNTISNNNVCGGLAQDISLGSDGQAGSTNNICNTCRDLSGNTNTCPAPQPAWTPCTSTC